MINTSYVPADVSTAARKPDAQPALPAASASQISHDAALALNKPVLAMEKAEQTGLKNRGDDSRKAEENAERLEDENTRFEISTDEDTGQRVFKHVVADNGHVLWQYPEESLLENAREQHKSEGVYADLKA